MLKQWLFAGIGAGVTICAAGATILVFFGVVIAILGLISDISEDKHGKV